VIFCHGSNGYSFATKNTKDTKKAQQTKNAMRVSLASLARHWRSGQLPDAVRGVPVEA
jgi:hypothetical protein